MRLVGGAGGWGWWVGLVDEAGGCMGRVDEAGGWGGWMRLVGGAGG